MNLDKHGLPVQSSGDANDQLQRVGMLVAAVEFDRETYYSLKTITSATYAFSKFALSESLQVSPGKYVRFIGGDPANVSADQLIGALGAHVALKNTYQIFLMFIRMLCRFGFAQNYKDGLSGKDKTKIPDFMLVRATPLFARMHVLLYPLAVVTDVLLLFAAWSATGPVWHDDTGFKPRNPNDVDDNNTILTLAVCRKIMPTPLSILATKIFGQNRAWNYGCTDYEKLAEVKELAPFKLVAETKYHPVWGALRWYHRKETGANPEIALMWKNICHEIFE